ncbi:MAG: hypothetical protein WCJ23_08615, partial [Verrucomicrobiota bacterium]
AIQESYQPPVPLKDLQRVNLVIINPGRKSPCTPSGHPYFFRMKPDPTQKPSGSTGKKTTRKISQGKPSDRDMTMEAPPEERILPSRNGEPPALCCYRSGQFFVRNPAKDAPIVKKRLKDGLSLWKDVGTLKEKALKGDRMAIYRIITMAEEYTSALYLLTVEKPDLVKPFAAQRATWPIPTAPASPSQHEEHVGYLRTIGLGTDQPFLRTQRNGKSGTVVNREARRFLNLADDLAIISRYQQDIVKYGETYGEKTVKCFKSIVRLETEYISLREAECWDLIEPHLPKILKRCENLPTVNKETLKLWIPLLRNIWMTMYKRHPENETKYHDIGGYNNKGDVDDTTPCGSKAANHRDHIWALIKQSMNHMVRPTATDWRLL